MKHHTAKPSTLCTLPGYIYGQHLVTESREPGRNRFRAPSVDAHYRATWEGTQGAMVLVCLEEAGGGFPGLLSVLEQSLS